MSDFNRIPTKDYLGNQVAVNDRVVLFSKRGIHFEGTVKQVGGKRWLAINEDMKIGGIGNSYILKI